MLWSAEDPPLPPPHPFRPLLLAEPVHAPPDQAEDGQRDHGEQGDHHPAKKRVAINKYLKVTRLYVKSVDVLPHIKVP